MTGSIVRLAAAVTALFVLPGTSAADSIPDTVKRWGLLGTWAADCSKGAAGTNVHSVFVQRGNDIFLDRHANKFLDSNKLLAATISRDGLLELRINFTSLSQTRVNVYVKGPDGRKRAMTNHDTKGAYTVKDGKFLSNDSPTPWMTRCR